MKKRIAVDIDDVLSTNAQDFVAYCNKTWGTRLTIDDYSDDWMTVWKVDAAEVKRRAAFFFESGAMSDYDYLQESILVLKALKNDYGYELVVVTSRNNVLIELTAKWLERYFKGVFSEVHHAGMWDNYRSGSKHMTKTALCKAIGANYLIDDQLKHCIDAAEAGISSLLFGEYAWNQSSELPLGVTRVRDWDAVQVYFQNLQGKA